MNLHKEYARLRTRGWPAAEAFRSAKINVAFDDARRAGQVDFRTRDDQEPFDASYIDTWTDLSETARDKARKDALKRVESEGTYGIVSYVLRTCSEGVTHEIEIDSCWGFIGDGWKDSGYDVDLKRAALDALKS